MRPLDANASLNVSPSLAGSTPLAEACLLLPFAGTAPILLARRVHPLRRRLTLLSLFGATAPRMMRSSPRHRRRNGRVALGRCILRRRGRILWMVTNVFSPRGRRAELYE